jgi:hypothetical protein
MWTGVLSYTHGPCSQVHFFLRNTTIGLKSISVIEFYSQMVLIRHF